MKASKYNQSMWEKAEKHLLKDKYIGPLIKKHGPCTIKPQKKREYFESLVFSIVGQQLSGKAVDSIFGRLKDSLNGEVVPEKILRKHDKTLRACGLSFAKIRYVKDLARKVKDGGVEIHKMDKLSDEKILEELVSVKGIGRWTAEMFLMFSLARPDVFPIGDLGVRKGMKKLLKRDRKPQGFEKFALRWKPYRTVASWYLWKHVDEQ